MKKCVKVLSAVLALSVIGTGSVAALLIKNANVTPASEPFANTINSAIPDVKNSETDTFDLSSNENITFETEKDEIWHKMLNSIDYYSSVSGKMFYAINPDNETCIEYQSNLDEATAYTSVSEVNVSDIAVLVDENLSEYDDKNTFDIEVFTDGNSTITLNNLDHTAVRDEYAVFTRENSGPIDDSDRVTVEEDGMPGYYYRCDVTNTYIASISLFPQEMAFGFLTDYELWDIDGIEEYVGRECYVISGKTSDDYKRKIGVEKFTFYVDCETGVLLKYIGYDETQNIYAYIVTDNIQFGNKTADVYKPDITNYAFLD